MNNAGSSNCDHFVLRLSPIDGMGGFAAHGLLKGTRVVEYLGEKISKTESLRRCEAGNGFIFALDDEFDLDGDTEKNPARFFNHSCDPNCDAEYIEGRIWIIARRDIAAGEEITFNYGYTLEEYREHPCHCGTAACVGYIVAEEFMSDISRAPLPPAIPR